MRLPGVVIETRKNSNYEVASPHEESPRDEHGFAPNVVDPYHGRNCREEHAMKDWSDTAKDYRKTSLHDAHHPGSKEGGAVTGQAEILEYEWCVVEDSIDAGPLLEKHRQRADSHTVEEGCICIGDQYS